MTQNDKWNEFLKNGSVLSYLSYAAQKKKNEKGENKSATSDTGSDNKRDQRG